MALNLKLKIPEMPKAVKIVLAFLPAVLIAALVTFLVLLPKHQETKRLQGEITKQENEIATASVKAAKLATLRIENEKLKKRLEELKLQLPEEKEVSTLLKQVSDLGIKSGLKVMFWKPAAKKDHPSGLIYEIPVDVELTGGYHNLGIFFSSLTKLNRIINISDINAGTPKFERGMAELKIKFKATTFSSIPEADMAQKSQDKDKGKGKAKPAEKPKDKA